ncbi:hypothetical protein [Ruegeria denitrificans]|nr:hypothetical protein [Ruegeria denitrificans]
MKPRFHYVRAFLNTNAALEVREMTPFALGYKPVSPITSNNEVLAC